ncbi:MAG: MFS transporter [Anaerolineae bacterium]
MSFIRRVRHHPRLGLILLAYVAFVALGMPDGLLGVAWPSIRIDYALPLDSVGLLIAAVIAGYTTSSFLSGPLMARLGVGRMLAASCALSGVGLIGYTLVPAWWLMVLLGIVAGLGAGAIDAGLNTYVASHFGEGLMQWLHASYGVGVTLGPIIMTVGLTTFSNWRPGYLAVGTFELLLAACFVLTLAMWADGRAPSAEEPQRLTDYRTRMRETLRETQVWLSALLFFLYVGGEAALGTWTYSLLIGTRGIDPAVAGFWAGSYWAMFTVGRVLAGLYAKRAGVNLIVMVGLGGAILGTILLAWNPAPVAGLLAVGIIGLSIAPIFPALMSGTSQRVSPRHAANAIGLQMAFTGLGMAAIPGLMGVLARRISLEVIPICLLAVYVALLGIYMLAVNSRGARAVAERLPGELDHVEVV